MIRLRPGFLLSLIIGLSFCGNPSQRAGNDAIDRKVDSLLAIMTLDEKIGQLTL